MYYVLFTYSKGRKERDFRKFRSEDELIDFLHEKYEEIEIAQIIGVEKVYRLGLIETDEFIRSELVLDDDKDPFPEGKTEEDIDRETKDLSDPGEKESSSRKHPYLRNREKEPSAMEKIIEETEEIEETGEQKIIRKNKEALKRADSAMEAAKKDLAKKERFIPKPDKKEPAKRAYERKSDHKKDWPTCPECHKEKMAPWNKSGRCSTCQQYKKISKKKQI